ncbi:MAG: AAA family ATPase [Clostridiales bacterium]|nr:AAA family ATPase [Clostridiales bacterium]
MNQLKLINLKDIEVEEVQWLIYPFIPYGKITIIEGDPGEGKTTLVLQIIARLTKGESIINDEAKPPINVIYQTAEDGLADTIKPRLLSADADCSKVLVIDDKDVPLTMCDARLEQAIVGTNAKLVVLDPIQGFLGSGVDMHRANEIRPVMKHIAELADKYKCAVILIGHMNKCSKAKSAYRGLGSIDFQAAARSVLIVGRIKDEPGIRVVCQTKNSLAPEAKSVAFKLSEDNGFEWMGEYDVSADELLSGKAKGGKKQAAMNFLESILADGQMPQSKIKEMAAEQGISEKTLRNAKDALNVRSQRINKQWYWSLD